MNGKEFYFQDEMRFGTRTDLGRVWTACGARPTGEQRIGYEFGYLSVAVNPLRGEIFLLLLPDMRVESFQAFLSEFEKFLRRPATLITDGAAAHCSSRLKFGERLELERLPPYSPELNLVERFFKELRATLKNRVFDTYEQVEAAVIQAVKPYLKDKEKVKRLTCYGWLLNAPT
ncbi:MAG: IS630 family transposase [Pyrinomonadaceae bacterium]